MFLSMVARRCASRLDERMREPRGSNLGPDSPRRNSVSVIAVSPRAARTGASEMRPWSHPSAAMPATYERPDETMLALGRHDFDCREIGRVDADFGNGKGGKSKRCQPRAAHRKLGDRTK